MEVLSDGLKVRRDVCVVDFGWNLALGIGIIVSVEIS
jgi:hypothetical protein